MASSVHSGVHATPAGDTPAAQHPAEGRPGAQAGLVPPNSFALTMALAALSVAWHQAADALGAPQAIATGLWAGAAAGWSLLVAGLLLDMVLGRFSGRLASVDQVNFLPTITVTLSLLAVAPPLGAPWLGPLLWWLALPAQALLSGYVLYRWLKRDFTGKPINAGWFVPMIAHTTLVTGAITHGVAEVYWVILAQTGLAWLALLPPVLWRLAQPKAGTPPPPVLMILLAPPCLFVNALLLIGVGVGTVWVLGLVGVVVAVVGFLASRWRALLGHPFDSSHYAFTFPLATFAVTWILLAQATGWLGLAMVAWAALALASVVVIGVIGRALVSLSPVYAK